MICFPNAKINIGLNVVERRPDGFHNIETVFVPIAWCDVLEFISADDNCMTLKNTGIEIEGEDSDNLIIRAYEILNADFDLPPLHIHLHKAIPFGAGLGGGSADAAFMLQALNTSYELNLSTADLQQYAQELGSDCPVFIENKSVYAEGTGNIFQPIDIRLDAYFFLLVFPGFAVNTQEAYNRLVPKRPVYSLKATVKQPVEEWKDVITNDFELAVFSRYPLLADLKGRFYQQGAVYAAMSGSGSSVFGIFKTKEQAHQCQQAVDQKNYTCWLGQAL